MPFPDDPDHNIPVIILRGKRPSKPKSFEERGISAGVWKIAKQCWNKEEGERLETDAVLQALETLFHSGVCNRSACIYSPWEMIDLRSE